MNPRNAFKMRGRKGSRRGEIRLPSSMEGSDQKWISQSGPGYFSHSQRDRTPRISRLEFTRAHQSHSVRQLNAWHRKAPTQIPQHISDPQYNRDNSDLSWPKKGRPLPGRRTQGRQGPPGRPEEQLGLTVISEPAPLNHWGGDTKSWGRLGLESLEVDLRHVRQAVHLGSSWGESPRWV